MINTEWGQFESELIPMLSTDVDLDRASAHPGAFTTDVPARVRVRVRLRTYR